MRRTADEVRDARSICALFQDTAAAHPERVALRSADGTITLTWAEYAQRVRDVAAGLSALGVGRGDTVALLLTNRPEFNIADAAAYHLGAVPFSVYNTSSAEQINYVFTNAENRVVICEEQYLSVLDEARTATLVQHVICVDANVPGTTALSTLAESGEPGFDFDAIWQSVTRDDLLTLIYTSGTTGAPKGVELTHANLLANLAPLYDLSTLDEHDRVVSYLPDAHIVNRYVGHYAPAVSGAAVTTVADRAQLLPTLIDFKPTVFVAVPLFWYKIQASLRDILDTQGGLTGRLARWAIDSGTRVWRKRTGGDALTLADRVQAAAAEQLVLKRIRSRVGLSDVRMALSGAAPISAETLEFVLGLGLPVCEAWGMSELTAVATVNPPNAIRIGTVGKPVAEVDLRVADDGELFVRGPSVMRGYRNDPKKTAAALDRDGWLATGDVGAIDRDGYVTIVDRKKELIINSGGKNMSPSNIENHLKATCPLIGSAVAIGDARPFVVALIALDSDAASARAKQLGIEPVSETMVAHPAVRAEVEAGIARANAKLSRVEQVKTFHLVSTFWEPGGDELTATAKLKRAPIAQKYAAEIERLYATARKP
ncbi:AMP-dependent synthetase/ligase [Mycolicibacterium sp. Dal123E01]|uniref:AMP-dependent synthetase/ligase n=1 Tax=Mycolicibacterium sp. Dal123E01 TaxID=3457578 RepID=UPI00403EA793